MKKQTKKTSKKMTTKKTKRTRREALPYERVAQMWNRDHKNVYEISDALKLTNPKNNHPYATVYGMLNRLRSGQIKIGKKALKLESRRAA